MSFEEVKVLSSGERHCLLAKLRWLQHKKEGANKKFKAYREAMKAYHKATNAAGIQVQQAKRAKH